VREGDKMYAREHQRRWKANVSARRAERERENVGKFNVA